MTATVFASHDAMVAAAAPVHLQGRVPQAFIMLRSLCRDIA